ncbi:MAG: hypothetical protein ACOY9J_12700 [Pseudomonadota bacterium]
MSDVVTITTAARAVWRLLVPVLPRLCLRRAFPRNKCGSMVQVNLSGSNATFELLSIRPAHVLSNLVVNINNFLPCDVDIEIVNLHANIDSSKLFDIKVDAQASLPAVGFGRIPLSEICLSDQQVRWIKGLSRDYTRVQFSLSWRCKCEIWDWEGSAEYSFPVYVRVDAAGMA